MSLSSCRHFPAHRTVIGEPDCALPLTCLMISVSQCRLAAERRQSCPGLCCWDTAVLPSHLLFGNLVGSPCWYPVMRIAVPPLLASFYLCGPAKPMRESLWDRVIFLPDK